MVSSVTINREIRKRLQYKTNFKLDLLSMTDIVLNHMSFDNPHISSHLDATFNIKTAPYVIYTNI